MFKRTGGAHTRKSRGRVEKASNGGTKVSWMGTVEGRAVKRAAQRQIELWVPDAVVTKEKRILLVGEIMERRMKKHRSVFGALLRQIKLTWPDDQRRWRNIGQRGFMGFYDNDKEGDLRFAYSPEHYTNSPKLREPEVVALANLLLETEA